ncbi:hypothetical protein [Nostoc sp. 'Peltigera membranacea cyanobiont' N6]|uniref:hypothetical protein n=1 Tax=Nostoc sp. 'Peltigera membranacea cyanobiont' N6 TaxID=1261031 RepID=UPI0015E410C0|nr:hypothetical protein [Nostoc sp. 'Peltigera membranacea cyanobiont' N6]
MLFRFVVLYRSYSPFAATSRAKTRSGVAKFPYPQIPSDRHIMTSNHVLCIVLGSSDSDRSL